VTRIHLSKTTLAPKASHTRIAALRVQSVLDVNGTPVDFVVDTGASQVVLSQFDARRVGLDPTALNYLGIANTANGQVRTAAVTLDTVTLGGYRDEDVRAVVNGGEMNGSLLGMTYLSRYDSISITDGELILSR